MKYVVVARKRIRMKYTADGSFKLKRMLLLIIIIETSIIALTYPFGNKAVVFGFKKVTNNHSVTKLLVLTNKGK